MSSGIYKLVFKDCAYVYIGQSKDIEARLEVHKHKFIKGTANYKLMAAYVLYGMPTLEILENTPNGLDGRELYYMEKYNSVEKGLNVVSHCMPNPADIILRKGHIPKSSRYPEEVYYNILLSCIADTTTEYTTSRAIAQELGVPANIVNSIRMLKHHTWLKVKFPKEYNILEQKYLVKKELSNGITKNKLMQQDNSATIDKIIKSMKTTEFYPDIKSPTGEVHTIKRGDLHKFAKLHNLSYTALNKVVNNKCSHEKGWILSL